MATATETDHPRILGLTGAIACGKSTVGDILLELGALERIDADREVHTLMEPGSPIAEHICRHFGNDVRLPDGGIDRAKLGKLVFSNTDALHELESIIHPAVRQRVRERIHTLRDRRGVVVVDAVKLLQSELRELCDAIWVVRCDAPEQMRRMQHVRRMSTTEASNRLAAQPSFDDPSVSALIDNSGSLDDLRHTVRREWEHLLRTAST